MTYYEAGAAYESYCSGVCCHGWLAWRCMGHVRTGIPGGQVDLRLSYRGRISLAWKHAIALVISRGGNYFSFIPLLTISLFWLSFLGFL